MPQMARENNVDTRFKKGNPGGNGREAGSRNFTFAQMFEKILGRPTLKMPETEKEIRKYNMCLKQVELAEQGDTKAFKIITEIMEGRPTTVNMLNMPGALTNVTMIDKQVLAQHGFEIRDVN